MREPNQRMFNQVLKAFEGSSPIGSGELFGVIVRYMDAGSIDLARSLAAHSFDMHEEQPSYIDGEHDCTEIYLETFRRAFYDEETAVYHGTGHIANDTNYLGHITSFLIERALSAEEQHETNVVIFPGSKSLN
jgi:hypothetical protein